VPTAVLERKNVSVAAPARPSRRRGRMTPVAARRSLYADRWFPRYRAALLAELNAITVRVVRQVALGAGIDEALSGAWAWQISIERVKERWIVPTVAQGYDLAGLEVAHQAGLKSIDDIWIQTEARWHGKAQAARKRQPLPAAQPATDPVIVGRPASRLRESGNFLLEGNFDEIDKWISTTTAAEVATKGARMRDAFNAASASRDPETGMAWTPREIAKEMLANGAADDKVRATMLARTGTIWAMNEGAQQRYANAGVTTMTWLTTSDDLRCPWCLEMDGRTVRTEDPFWSRGSEFGVTVPGLGGVGSRTRSLKMPNDVQHPPLHPNCLVGETTVVSPDKVAGLIASYDGPIVEIAFANSSRLTVTPNHMLLTPRGFARVASLCEGDDVIDGFALQRIVPSDPNDDGNPTSIRDVVESLAETRGVSTSSVPVSPEDVHGDARFFQGNVDVVGTNGLLQHRMETATTKPMSEALLPGTNSEFQSFARCSNLSSVLLTLGLASHGGVGWRSECKAFRRRESRHANLIRLANGAYADASAEKVAAYPAPGNGEDLGEGEFRLSFDVPTTHVTSLRIRQFSGHVYDLQSRSGLYIANGVLSSNCRCTVIPVLTEQQAYGIREVSI